MIHKAKKVCAAFAFLCLASSCFALEFRNTSWMMTGTDVIASETSRVVSEESYSNQRQIVFRSVVNGYTATITYLLEDDKLLSASYTFAKDLSSRAFEAMKRGPPRQEWLAIGPDRYAARLAASKDGDRPHASAGRNHAGRLLGKILFRPHQQSRDAPSFPEQIAPRRLHVSLLALRKGVHATDGGKKHGPETNDDQGADAADHRGGTAPSRPRSRRTRTRRAGWRRR